MKNLEIECPCPFEDVYVGVCTACQRRKLANMSDMIKVKFGNNFRYFLGEPPATSPPPPAQYRGGGGRVLRGCPPPACPPCKPSQAGGQAPPTPLATQGLPA